MLRSMKSPENEVPKWIQKELKAEIDKTWAEVAKRRLAEIRSGAVKIVSGQEVFDRVKGRFGKCW